jgi:hypothetical protein
VKPANVVLDERYQPCLTDFDLATVSGTTGGTRTGALGSVVYAAPEMLHRPQEAGPPADVYGIGMTLVFLLARENLQLDILRDAAGFVDRLDCHRRLKPILKRCLAWRPADRYQNASELATALDALNLAKPIAEAFTDTATGIRFLGIPDARSDDGGLATDPQVAADEPKYWIAETAVTNRQYDAFLGETDQASTAEAAAHPDAPVVRVSFRDALRYCVWLSRSLGRRVTLPTVSQWRYAASGPSRRLYPWGDQPPDASRCHYRFNHGEEPLPVGSLPEGRGAFGTLDQAGSTWEWCLDPAPIPRDRPTGDGIEGRLLCGGSFAASADGVRLSSVIVREAGGRYADVGFRVAIVPIEAGVQPGNTDGSWPTIIGDLS